LFHRKSIGPAGARLPARSICDLQIKIMSVHSRGATSIAGVHLGNLEHLAVANFSPALEGSRLASRSSVSPDFWVQFGVPRNRLAILFALSTAILSTAILSTVTLAVPYTVKPGDTLSSIARAFSTQVPALKRLNNLRSDVLEVGMRLEVPGTQKPGAQPVGQNPGAPVIRVSSVSLTLTHKASAKPGEPVTIRISGALERPTVIWGVGRSSVENPGQGKSGTLQEGEMQLVMVRDGNDWVGVGRDILGTPAETIKLEVRAGSQTLNSSLKLLGDPRPLQDVFMSKQVMATLTDENRARERAVLTTAYTLSETTPRAWTKAFAWPVPDRQISVFGQNRRYEQGGDLNFHYGEDLVAQIGAPIHASNDGTIVIAGCYPIRGCLTGINHGAGLVSTYFHQSKILVKIGQRISKGELIGLAGKTGFANGPHLHIEFRVRGEATNPRDWMGKIWP
jgi:murein DD-endopeptidase MepM/ murein hydrolase activator NlpD